MTHHEMHGEMYAYDVPPDADVSVDVDAELGEVFTIEFRLPKRLEDTVFRLILTRETLFKMMGSINMAMLIRRPGVSNGPDDRPPSYL